jgi:excisionase family DNA binding protein
MPQQPETTEAKPACGSDAVAESAPDETRFGAPVVHEVPRDPGPHECLLTVREVAARFGVSSPLVYKLCLRNELQSLRIGGALRFREDAVQSFLATRARC